MMWNPRPVLVGMRVHVRELFFSTMRYRGGVTELSKGERSKSLSVMLVVVMYCPLMACTMSPTVTPMV